MGTGASVGHRHGCDLKKLGKYEVLGELGRGAMGIVYRARDPMINRLVALKTITTGVADDPALLERFYREAQSAGPAASQHCNHLRHGASRCASIYRDGASGGREPGATDRSSCR